jgi:RNA polymerase sigma-70 factor (ECF subfamily)
MAQVDRTPEDETSARELTRMIERTVDTLPEIYRSVFVLRDVEEMSTAETAACLGITEETARIRLHRARHLLQAAIAEAVGPAAVRAFGFAGDRCDRIVASVLTRLGIVP